MDDLFRSICEPRAFIDELDKKLDENVHVCDVRQQRKGGRGRRQRGDHVRSPPTPLVVEAAAELDDTLTTLLSNWRQSRRRIQPNGDLQAGASHLKERFDRTSADLFVQRLSELDEKLAELKVWDIVLCEMAEKEEVCSSKPLRQVLRRVRSFLHCFADDVEEVFGEIRRRIQFDWTLKELQRKREMVSRETKKRLDSLQESIDIEREKNDIWQSELALVKESLKNTSSKLTFTDSKAERVHNAAEEQRALNEPHRNMDIVPIAKNLSFRESMQNLPSSNLGPSQMIRIHEKQVKVHQLENGSRVSRHCTSGSHYYRFDLDRNDSGITLLLSQEPAGDSRNFVQVLLNFGSPPTSVDRTHCIRTRNCKHVYLDLHDANLASGTWYIKISGFGSGLKRFAVEFRVNTRLSSDGDIQRKALASVLTEISDQQVIARQMNTLEDVTHKTATEAMKKLMAPRDCRSVAIQTTSPFKKKKHENRKSIKLAVPPMGHFCRFLKLPAPAESTLRKQSLRSVLKTILHVLPTCLPRLAHKHPGKTIDPKALAQIYEEKIVADDAGGGEQVTSLSEFIYDSFIHRYGLAKLAEHNIHELVAMCKTRFSKIPRVNMFSRLCGIVSPVLEQTDLDFFLGALRVLRKSIDATPGRGFDDSSGNIFLTKHHLVESVKAIFSSESQSFRSKVLKEAVKAKEKGRLNGDLVLDVMHRLWKEKNKARNEELIKIFTELDMDASGTIDYIRFIVAMEALDSDSVNCRDDMTLIRLFGQMVEASNRLEWITLPGFMSVCSRNNLESISWRSKHRDNSRDTIRHSNKPSPVPFESWNELDQAWNDIQTIVFTQVRMVRQHKFRGHEELWKTATEFKDDLRLHEDLQQTNSLLVQMLRQLNSIASASPIILEPDK